MDAWKKLKLQTVKNTSNLASFYDSHIDGIICVKQIDLGLAKTLDIIERLKFNKNELRLQLHYYIWIHTA